MKSKNQGPKSKELQKVLNQVQVLEKNPVAQATARAMGKASAPIVTTNRELVRANWKDIEDLRVEIANYFMQMLLDFKEASELVQRVNIPNLSEFRTLVTKTTQHFDQFSKDLQVLRSQHEKRSGPVKNGDELSVFLRIFENYEQFRTKFQAVIQHSMIHITEHALRARAILEAQEASEASAKSQQPTTPAAN